MPGRLTLLLVVEAVGLGIARLASSVHFEWFAFFDGGAELAVHEMMRRGLRPTVDFGYIYGLLPLAVGEAWYRVAGLTPLSFAVASILCDALATWGMARVLRALKAGPVAVAWVVVTMPVGAPSMSLPSLTHAIEPVLLMHALADVADGRYRRALALAVACAFAKPSMAYLLIAGIVGIVVLRDRPSGWRSWASLAAPACAVAIGLSTVLALGFGVSALIRSFLPLAGRAVYRANRYGFVFGVGRDFWWPDRARWGYYAGTVAGPWLVANVVLIAASLAWISRSRRRIDEPAGGIQATANLLILCAALHSAFVVLFFGNQWSWVYYFPVLVVGLSGVAARGRTGAVAVLVLTCLMLPSAWRSVRGSIEGWQGRSRSVDTFGAWASPKVRQEWREVRKWTSGRRAVLLATTDGATLFEPSLSPPDVLFLVRGHYLPGEMARKLSRIRGADAVVVANPAPGEPWFDRWPEFAAELGEFRLVWSSPRLRVYSRTAHGS